MTRVSNSSENRVVFKFLWLMIGTLVLAVAIDAQSPHGSQSAKSPGSMASKDDFRFEVFSIPAIYLTPPGPTGCGLVSFANGTGSI